MPRKGKSKPTGRKSGAQPGNKNAMRHGFYAQRFTADQNNRLDQQKPVDVQSEIALIRICIEKLRDELNFEAAYLTDAQKNETRDDHYLKALNTLAIMTQSLSTLVRTQHLVHGKTGDVQDSILRALEELRLEMGI